MRSRAMTTQSSRALLIHKTPATLVRFKLLLLLLATSPECCLLLLLLLLPADDDVDSEWCAFMDALVSMPSDMFFLEFRRYSCKEPSAIRPILAVCPSSGYILI